MLFLLAPILSNAPESANPFFDELIEGLPTEPVMPLDTRDRAEQVAPGPREVLVVFDCPAPGTLPGGIEDLIRRAEGSGATVVRVAMDPSCRPTAGRPSDRHAFDVAEWMRRRQLQPSQQAAVAQDLARELVSILRPTCSVRDMHVFVSYKRDDMEQSAFDLERGLGERGIRVHRDLVDLQAGDLVRPAIVDCLERADMMLLLDSPRAPDSDWIQWEIELALRHAVPILWVRIGEHESRRPLPFPPSRSPDVEIPSDDAAASFADDIFDAIERRTRTHVRTAQGFVSHARDWADRNAAEFVPLDARYAIYQLRRTRKRVGNYPLRPATDVLQVFGRRPRPEDVDNLTRWLESRKLGPHASACRAFDAAVIVAPGSAQPKPVGDWSLVEEGYRYLANLSPSSGTTGGDQAGEPPRLLLLGALPDRPDSEHHAQDAVREVSEHWLHKGGGIVFGGHPTFVPIIEGVVDRTRPGEEQRLVTMYWSRWFEDPQQHHGPVRLPVTWTPAGDTRAASLRTMREEMISESHAAAAVAIGGRLHEDDAHTPGVPEEVELARRHRIPCFLLGATGGATGRLCGDRMHGDRMHRADGWEDLGNSLDDDQNRHLAVTDDYRHAAEVIWQASVR